MRRWVLLCCAAAAVLTPAAGAAPRPVCGVVRGDGVRYTVVVERGPLRCRTARAVLVDLFAGRGTPHAGATPRSAYTQVGRWRCGFGMGSWACTRKPSAQQVSAVPRGG